MQFVSVVIPIFKSAETIAELVHAIIENLSKVTDRFEIILVDDGSPDNSWSIIESLTLNNAQVKALKLSRNFGQHPAIITGLENCVGDFIIVMDADFQNDPSYIPLLFAKAQQGFDTVYARRLNRKDPKIKILLSNLFYRLFSYLIDRDFDGAVGIYGIYNRKVINAVLAMKEHFKVFSLMTRWVGFNQTTLDVEHKARLRGESSYTFSKLIDLALSIMINYSQKPLNLIIKMGLFISIPSFLFTAYNVANYLLGNITALGYSSVIASIFFIGGIIIFSVGIIGLYIGKLMEGLQNRPVIVSSKINFHS